MIWAWILVAIGVVLLATLVGWAIWLAHKAGDVYHQLVDLGGKVGKLAEQVERLDLSPLETAHPRPGDLPGSLAGGQGSISGPGGAGEAPVAPVRTAAPHPRRAQQD